MGRRGVAEHRQDETDADEPDMTPLDRRQVGVLTVRIGLAAVVLAGIALILDMALREAGIPAFALPGAALALGLAATLILPRRRYRRWGYREGADELQIVRGMLIRVRTIVPFGRVQHIDVAQGPVQRPFGLATLILHTAGTHGAAVALPGLAMADAEAMRDRIRGKIREEFG
jgi:membrane protein YdbS with pleckstrin-like domain